MFDRITRMAKSWLSRAALVGALVVSVVVAGPASTSQADATGSVYFPNNTYSTMSPGITFGGPLVPFTIQAWFKAEYSTTVPETVVILGAAPGVTKGLSFLAVPGANLREWKLDGSGSFAVPFTFPQAPTANQWHYIVASRDSSGYMQIWIDGVASNSGRTNLTNVTGQPAEFTALTSQYGAWTGNTRFNWDTYVSNVRVTNTNLFDTTASTIPVPTSPLTVVAGTQLLMNTATLSDSSGTQTSFVSTGSPVLSSQNPFFGAATVTGISPSSGPTQGGTPVTITGTNLSNATVTIGGVAATIVSTTSTSIDLLTPAGSVGSQSVVVTGAAGTPTTSFTYQVVNLPGAPTLVSATSGGTLSSVVSWTAPGSTGGSAITEYQVLSSGGQTCTSVTTSCTMTGLSAGTSYTFTVRAKNILGYGSYSSASAPVSTASDAALASTGNQGSRSILLGIASVMLIALGANLIGLRRVKLAQK